MAHRRHRRTVWLAAFATTLGLILGPCVTPAAAQTVGPDGKPITNTRGVRFGIISHRGGAGEHPENSVEAYEFSVAQGFDVIETDLLFTSGRLDSFSTMNLVMFLEENFAIDFSDFEFDVGLIDSINLSERFVDTRL